MILVINNIATAGLCEEKTRTIIKEVPINQECQQVTLSDCIDWTLEIENQLNYLRSTE